MRIKKEKLFQDYIFSYSFTIMEKSLTKLKEAVEKS